LKNPQPAVKRRRIDKTTAPGPSPSSLATVGVSDAPVSDASTSASSCQNDPAGGAGEPNELETRPVIAPPTLCPNCFLDPCVITRPHNFLGPGRSACDDNAALRRAKYKKYWNMLKYLGAWGKPQYVELRRQAVAADPAARGQNQREIMPMCVLKRVRSLYPNRPDVPYMGHVWV
jgi:hypothetical protein